MEKYNINYPEQSIEKEITKFIQREKLTDRDLQRLNNKIQKLAKNTSDRNILENKNNNKSNIQNKSAEKTTRNPKYFKNESIYNTNYIINFIESNDVKNSKLGPKNKLDVSNKIYTIGQKEIKNNNLNNEAYKMLTDITKNNVNEILSKNNVQMKNKKYLDLNDGQKYKNPEELHFSMVKITQNINRLKGKF